MTNLLSSTFISNRIKLKTGAQGHILSFKKRKLQDLHNWRCIREATVALEICSKV